MKFIHFGDSHLGKTEEKLEEREEDFYKVFEEVIDRCISEKVDFVIHSGDLFDKSRPNTKTLVFLVKQLRRLYNANIPFFIVPGSHDIGVDGTFISVLDEIGLVKNLASKRYVEVNDNSIILKGEHYKDAFICGVAGRRDRISDVYLNLKISDKGKYNIFIFHHIVSDIADKFADIPTSLLPKGFNYYAGGHWHGFAKIKYGDGIIVYPGSTEYNDLDEMARDKNKYFILVEVNDENTIVKEIPLKTRQIVLCELNCNNFDSRDVAKKAMEKIPKNNNGAILIIKLLGRLAKGVKSEINRDQIKNFAKENGYLYTKIYMADLENPETPHVSTKSRSVHDIEKEYLKKQNYSDNEIKVAEKLMELLGQKLSQEELQKATINAIKLVKGELIENKGNSP